MNPNKDQPVKEVFISSKMIQEKAFVEGKWLGIKLIDYTIGDKVIENYEMAYRPTTKKGSIGGISIVPIIKYKQKPTEIVFIAVFRPPCGKFVLEFPAGLVESSDYLENAKRQLKEETGLTAHKFINLPQIVNRCDPWKSNESGIMYIGMVDGDDPSAIGDQQLEAEQNIRVYRLLLNDNLVQELVKLADKNGYGIQSKTYLLSLGFGAENILNKKA